MEPTPPNLAVLTSSLEAPEANASLVAGFEISERSTLKLFNQLPHIASADSAATLSLFNQLPHFHDSISCHILSADLVATLSLSNELPHPLP